MSIARFDGREASAFRSVKISYDALGYADSSVLFEMGNTKVFVAISLQQGVPHFLKGQKTGWLTAEYSMLPTATHQRTVRESHQGQRNYRNIEISRLIGRCLRSIIDFSLLGERSIFVDCDVLQADGGTRVASLTAASIALDLAMQRWVERSVISQNAMRDRLAALSAGVLNGNAVLDLCYQEDSQAQADFNFVMTRSGQLIEIQGTAEQKPLSFDLFESVKALAQAGIAQLFEQTDLFPLPIVEAKKKQQQSGTGHTKRPQTEQKSSFFSLANRVDKTI